MTWHPLIRLDHLDRLDRTIAVAVTILVATLVIAALPGVVVRLVAPGLDVVFDTVATLVTLAVAALAWARYRDRGQWVDLCVSAAFLVLALAKAIAAILALRTLETAAGSAVVPYSEAFLYVSVVAHIVAAAVLVAGGAPAPRSLTLGRPIVVAVMPATLVLGVALALLAVPGSTFLPPLVDATAVASPGEVVVLPGVTLVNVVLQAVGALLFAAAAVLARRRAREEKAVFDRYLTVGLVVAVFAQLHLMIFPSAYAGVMTSGDLLYLAFDLILLLGIEAESRAHVVSLRQANLGLQRLREVEVERAAIEERARLSRELHDGLAQDLWFAKLKIGRLAATPGLDPDSRTLCAELDAAIDTALADARQAVMALRMDGEPGTPFRDLLARTVDDFADRFGLRTEFDCPAEIPPLGARAEAELLRILQEALSNVRRHADATLIRVRADLVAGRLVLAVHDNGCGFDPLGSPATGFGLVSMRERAALLGGRLAITSRPRDGTTVTVDVAVPGPGLAIAAMVP